MSQNFKKGFWPAKSEKQLELEEKEENSQKEKSTTFSYKEPKIWRRGDSR